MSNLVAAPGLDEVFQLETTTVAIGGPGGVANAQAQALLNRTEWLRAQIINVKDPQFAGGAKGDGVTDDTAAILAAIAAFPNQGAPNWQPWALVFPTGNYKVSSKITIKNQQFGRVIGYGATISGNFNDTVLQFGDATGSADMLWFHVEGLRVAQYSTGASAYAVRAFHNYSCSYRNCFFYGGQYTFTLDGNANLLSGCTFRGGIAGNVLAAGTSNNEANTFHVCSNELSSGYGYVFSIAAGNGGMTTVKGGYVESNASGSFYIKNSQKVVISDLYFNQQNLAPGIVLDGTVGASYTQPYVTVEDCEILGHASTSSQFIKELTTSTINAQYRRNRVVDGVVDLYGGAPRSVNADRKRKASSIANATSIVNSDSTGAPDGWTLSGSGNVATTTANSPYVNGSAAVISVANGYIYQQINVPANALVRVSVWANVSGVNAIAALQLWSVGLGAQYLAGSMTSTTPGRIEIVLSPAARSSATAFLLLLRNAGTGDTAVFCDVEIEDLTN